MLLQSAGKDATDDFEARLSEDAAPARASHSCKIGFTHGTQRALGRVPTTAEFLWRRCGGKAEGAPPVASLAPSRQGFVGAPIAPALARTRGSARALPDERVLLSRPQATGHSDGARKILKEYYIGEFAGGPSSKPKPSKAEARWVEPPPPLAPPPLRKGARRSATGSGLTPHPVVPPPAARRTRTRWRSCSSSFSRSSSSSSQLLCSM